MKHFYESLEDKIKIKNTLLKKMTIDIFEVFFSTEQKN